MIKYAVKMLKNKFFPLIYPEGTELESGQYILVQTEKGEEAVRVFLVNSEIAKHWEKFKPQPLNLVRVMSKEDIAKLDEIKNTKARKKARTAKNRLFAVRFSKTNESFYKITVKNTCDIYASMV